MMKDKTLSQKEYFAAYDEALHLIAAPVIEKYKKCKEILDGKNKLVIQYLLGVFLLSYLIWGILILAQELNWFQYDSPASMIFVFVGGNSPAIIVYLIRKISEPKFTLKQYLKEIFVFKQNSVHYIFVLLFIVIFFAVPAIMGGIASQLELFAGDTQATAPMPIWLTVISISLFFFLGGSEEIGWRSFLLPKLEEKITFIPAIILNAFIWFMWHLPLFLITGTSQNSSDLISFALYIVGASFVLDVIFKVSKSVWLCILFHCATNALQGSWPLIDNYLIKAMTAIALIIAAFAVMILNKKVVLKHHK